RLARAHRPPRHDRPPLGRARLHGRGRGDDRHGGRAPVGEPDRPRGARRLRRARHRGLRGSGRDDRGGGAREAPRQAPGQARRAVPERRRELPRAVAGLPRGTPHVIGRDGHALFARIIGGAKRFTLTTHVNPDGDALGSEIGLTRYLRSLGKELRIVNQDATPENLRFLEADGLTVELFQAGAGEAALRDADVVRLLDNSAPDRLGRMESAVLAVAAKVLCIDHHPTRGTPGARNILDEEASATAAMVHGLVKQQGYALDRRAAEALYVGLATDTGFFRFN